MIRLGSGTAGAIAFGVVLLYAVRFCATGFLFGECRFEVADWVLRLHPAAAWEVRR